MLQRVVQGFLDDSVEVLRHSRLVEGDGLDALEFRTYAAHAVDEIERRPAARFISAKCLRSPELVMSATPRLN